MATDKKTVQVDEYRWPVEKALSEDAYLY